MIIMMAWRKVVGNVQWVQSEVQPSLCTQLTSEVNSSNKGSCEGLNYHTPTKFFSPFFFAVIMILDGWRQKMSSVRLTLYIRIGFLAVFCPILAIIPITWILGSYFILVWKLLKTVEMKGERRHKKVFAFVKNIHFYGFKNFSNKYNMSFLGFI